jgi:hypothetical protein
MPKDDDQGKSKDPLVRWRQAEQEYAEAVAPFLTKGSSAPIMTKKQLVELVSLRNRAERWCERYFKENHRELP